MSICCTFNEKYTKIRLAIYVGSCPPFYRLKMYLALDSSIKHEGRNAHSYIITTNIYYFSCNGNTCLLFFWVTSLDADELLT